MKKPAEGAVVASVKGYNGRMTFDGSSVTVANRKAMKFNAADPTVIPLESIDSVQFHKPTLIQRGYIRIVTPSEGPTELKVAQSLFDEKTIVVLLGKNGPPRRFANQVMEAVAARRTAALPFISESVSRLEFRTKHRIPEDAVFAAGISTCCAFDGTYVTIERFRTSSLLSIGVKRISLASITSVMIKPRVGIVEGTIQFNVGGAFNDSITFTPSQEASFKALRDAIEDAQSAVSAHSGAPSSGVLDQILQLGELRDSGIVTPAEFELKKAELLGRL